MKERFILFLLMMGLAHLRAGANQFSGESIAVDSLRWKHGLECPFTFSYLGYSANLGYFISKKSGTFSAGARTSFTYFTRYSDIPYGVYINYQHTMSSGKKLTSFTELFYDNLFFNVASPNGLERGLYQAHEVYLAYGFKYRFRHLVFAHSIGTGWYRESHPNFYGSAPLEQHNIGYFMKLSFGYAF